MPRNMSFMLTTEQYRNRTKTVTRRLAWWNLKEGEVLNGVEKSQGLRKGERIKKLGQHRIISTRRERLADITDDDVKREGFPEWTREQFIEFFCKSNQCQPSQIVNRIEFEYLR